MNSVIFLMLQLIWNGGSIIIKNYQAFSNIKKRANITRTDEWRDRIDQHIDVNF